jgi:hypothetical protein
VLVTTVTSIETLRRSPRAALFEGRDDIPVSMFMTEYDRGEGPDQHLHRYADVRRQPNPEMSPVTPKPSASLPNHSRSRLG